MTKFFLALLIAVSLLGNSLFANQQPDSLSAQARISLLTAEPGYFLFEAFGHSSFRISDEQSGLDRVYNYGAFNFFQENFYINFMRGYMKYYLGVRNYSKVHADYYRRGVRVYEQELQLQPQEKQALFNFLEENRKEENKYYYYDYFYDNCATKYRDILEHQFGDNIQFYNPHPDSVFTIRQLMKRYTGKHKWGQFGIDLALGSTIDEPTNFRDYMYLPDYLMLAFDNAQINRYGQELPLVKEKRILIEPLVETTNSSIIFSPTELAWILLAMGVLLCLFDYFRKQTTYWFDIILFSSVGIAGSILALIWFGTNHGTAANNYNLIWALPTHLIVAILLLFQKRTVLVRYYFLINGMLSGALLFGWSIVPQDLHSALVPIVFLIFLRSLLLYRSARKTALPVQPLTHQ